MPPRSGNPFVIAIAGLIRGAKSVDFWLLFITFAVCGFSTNGLVATHLIPFCIDHGIPAVSAASLLAAMGVFDLVGTTVSGYLTDRYDLRILLFWYYGLRGLSLVALPFTHFDVVSLGIFAAFYGLDWVATIPPTVTLTNTVFGKRDAPVIVRGSSPDIKSVAPSQPSEQARPLPHGKLRPGISGERSCLPDGGDHGAENRAPASGRSIGGVISCKVGLKMIYRRPGERLDVVDQRVRTVPGDVLIGARDGTRDGGVQARCQRQVSRLFVVHVPEPAGKPIHQAHGRGGELVAGGVEHQQVEFTIQAHEGDVVRIPRRVVHTVRDRRELQALQRCGAFGGGAREEALDLPPCFQQAELADRIDFGNHDATPRHDDDQPLAGQALEGLADGGSADTQAAAEDRLGHDTAGRDAQGDDLFFQRAVGFFSQRLGLQEFVVVWQEVHLEVGKPDPDADRRRHDETGRDHREARRPLGELAGAQHPQHEAADGDDVAADKRGDVAFARRAVSDGDGHRAIPRPSAWGRAPRSFGRSRRMKRDCSR